MHSEDDKTTGDNPDGVVLVQFVDLSSGGIVRVVFDLYKKEYDRREGDSRTMSILARSTIFVPEDIVSSC